MRLNADSYQALKAFERSPGSVRREGETRVPDQTEREIYTLSVRDQLSSAQSLCGPAQHRFTQRPESKEFYSSPYLRSHTTTSSSSETWTHPTKNAFVKVDHQVTTSDSEGFSLSGASVFDSCGSTSRGNAAYGVETNGYIAGMKITENDRFQTTATAFKIDKREPDKSWVQTWNIR